MSFATVNGTNHRVRPSSLVSAVLAISLLTSMLVMGAQQAFAAPGPNPFMSAIVTLVEDGTGHGTTAQSFVNSQNGFSPGDDAPDDGVVSSNDYATYRIDLKISSATARTVTLRMDTPDYLDPEGFARFCRSMTALKTTVVDNNICQVAVPAGVTASLSGNAVLKARDTAGTIKSDQVVSLSSGVLGQSPYAKSEAAPVTVVSAPAADLWIKNEVMPDWANLVTGAFA